MLGLDRERTAYTERIPCRTRILEISRSRVVPPNAQTLAVDGGADTGAEVSREDWLGRAGNGGWTPHHRAESDPLGTVRAKQRALPGFAQTVSEDPYM